VNFRQRFLRYGIGVFIGVILSALFFSGRSCNDWLPAKRIKARMQLDGVSPDAYLSCLMQCEGPTAASREVLMTWLLNSEIQWSLSEPRGSQPCYHLKMPLDCPFSSMKICFSNDEGELSQAVLSEDIALNSACSCALATDAGQ